MREIGTGIRIGMQKLPTGDYVLLYADDERGGNGVRISEAEAQQVRAMLAGATRTTELSLNNGRAVLRLEKVGSDFDVVWAGNPKYADKKTRVTTETCIALATDIDGARAR